MFPGINPRVVEVPDFRPLIFWIPLPETVAKAEKAFFGAGFFLIAPGPTDEAVETKFLGRSEQRGDLQSVAADLARGGRGNAAGDGVLDLAHDQFGPQLSGAPVTKLVELGEMMAGVHIEQRHGQFGGAKRFFRQAQQADGILAPRK